MKKCIPFGDQYQDVYYWLGCTILSRVDPGFVRWGLYSTLWREVDLPYRF